jgi:hypothetical protein
MEVEGWIGAERSHDRRAGRHEHPHDEVEEAVDAFADHDIVDRHAEMLCQGRLEFVIVGVAVHPHIRRRLPHRCDDGWRRTEARLVGADAGAEGTATRALLGFRPDEGDAGRQRIHQRRQSRSVGHLAEPSIFGSAAQHVLGAGRVSRNPETGRRCGPLPPLGLPPR